MPAARRAVDARDRRAPLSMHARARHALASCRLRATVWASGVARAQRIDRQADVVADVAEVEPAKREAFVRGLGLPELKASKLLKALAGEVRG